MVTNECGILFIYFIFPSVLYLSIFRFRMSEELSNTCPGSSQSSATSQTTPSKSQESSDMNSGSSQNSATTQVTPSKSKSSQNKASSQTTPSKAKSTSVKLYTPIPTMSPSTSQGPESQLPVNPTKSKLEELEECNSAKFLECDTHLKAALYSVSKNERKEATDSIVRRLMKGIWPKLIS